MALVRAGFVRQHSGVVNLALRVADVAVLAGFGWLVYWLSGDVSIGSRDLNLLALCAGLSGAFAFEQYGLYQGWRGSSLAQELKRIVAASLTAIGLTVALVAIVDPSVVDGVLVTVMLAWFVLGTGTIAALRFGLRTMLRMARANGFNQKRVLLAGMSSKSLYAARRLAGNASLGYLIEGYVDDRAEPRGLETQFPRLGGAADAERLIAERNIDEVWIGYAMSGEQRTRELIQQLRDLMVGVKFLLEAQPFDVRHCTMTEMSGVPMLTLHAAPLDDRPSRVLKGLFDRGFAALALTAAAPLFIVLAIGVRLSSPGPVFYRQERVTWKKQRFTMLKFRSMPVNSETASGPVWATPGDNRATRFGSFLRRTSLDELPQLINVLRGEMSIVGPRPERPEFVEQFKDQVPWYMKKHMVKAGITGWAQVNGWRGETDLARRIEHDIYYIQHWSLWLDLQIILRTFVSGFVHKNAY